MKVSQGDKVPFFSRWHLPKFWDKKRKATAKVTPQESPMKEAEQLLINPKKVNISVNMRDENYKSRRLLCHSRPKE